MIVKSSRVLITRILAADDDIETFTSDRRKPTAMKELRIVQFQLLRVALSNSQSRL